MKRKILTVLLMLICLVSLVACATDSGTTSADGLQKARDYVKATYRDEAEITNKDYTRVTSVNLDGETYSIAWSVADAEGNATTAATVGEPKDGQVTISINRRLTEETAYVLTGVISDAAGESMEITFKHKTPVLGPKVTYLEDVVANPAVGTAYKLAMWQGNKGKVYYATGDMSTSYLATTTDVAKAVDTKIEAAEGGYYIKLGDKYLTIVGRINDKGNLSTTISLADTATTVFTIGNNNELIFTASATPAGEGATPKTDTFYIGTYSKYETISASATSYISDTSKIDDSQFPARLVLGTKINEDETPDGGDSGESGATTDAKSKYLADVVATPAVNTAYKFAMWQNSFKKVYYATGAMNGYYLATTTDVANAADAKLETAEGGYHIKLGTKYLNIVAREYESNGSTKLSTTIKLEDTATTVYTIGTNNVITFTVSGVTLSDTFYIGSYGTNTTISASKTSYISGESASLIDDTQYVARLVKGTKINADWSTSGGDSGSTGGDSGSTGGTTTPTITPSTDKTAAYTFTSTTTPKSDALTADAVLTLLNKSTTSDALVSVKVTNIYEGNNTTGGAYPSQAGFLKSGTSKANGQLVLTFAEDKKATKVEIKCHDWYKLTSERQTNTNGVAVNGSDAVLAPYNADGTPAVLTFELDGTSNEVTFDFTKRVFIFEIIVTFA